METSELLKQVRRIEIKTKGLSQNIFAGEYHSAFKGLGMTFAEVREYQYGDDVRSIDWNVTARFGHPYVKVFEEERELTVMLLVDVSGSRDFGTVSKMKKDIFGYVQNEEGLTDMILTRKPTNGIKPIMVMITYGLSTMMPNEKRCG